MAKTICLLVIIVCIGCSFGKERSKDDSPAEPTKEEPHGEPKDQQNAEKPNPPDQPEDPAGSQKPQDGDTSNNPLPSPGQRDGQTPLVEDGDTNNIRLNYLSTRAHIEGPKGAGGQFSPWNSICIDTNMTTLGSGSLPKTSHLANYNNGDSARPLLVAKLDRFFMQSIPNSIKIELGMRHIPIESVDLFWNVQSAHSLGHISPALGFTRLKAHGWAAPDAPLVYPGSLVNRDFLMGIYEPDDLQISYDLEVGKVKPYPVHVHDLDPSLEKGNGISPPGMARIRISRENSDNITFWSLVIDDKNPEGDLKANVTLHWVLSSKPLLVEDRPWIKFRKLLYKSLFQEIGDLTLSDVLDRLNSDPYFSQTKMVKDLSQFLLGKKER